MQRRQLQLQRASRRHLSIIVRGPPAAPFSITSCSFGRRGRRRPARPLRRAAHPRRADLQLGCLGFCRPARSLHDAARPSRPCISAKYRSDVLDEVWLYCKAITLAVP